MDTRKREFDKQGKTLPYQGEKQFKKAEFRICIVAGCQKNSVCDQSPECPYIMALLLEVAAKRFLCYLWNI